MLIRVAKKDSQELEQQKVRIAKGLVWRVNILTMVRAKSWEMLF